MKAGKFEPLCSPYDVKLPQEIIAVVISHVRACVKEDLRRRTLYSCCLLSRSWYSTAIPYLYEAPRLSNKNFDKFARTICPPVNSHVRHIGLESFIRQLDMSRLAYESSKSLTARLLRRTRVSLEHFTAPAVSFSVTCLAPLSKCRSLQSLDLSRDHYDIDLTQLLNAVGGLPYLTSISLPRNAMTKKCKLKVASSGETSWPARLSHLQINDCLPQNLGHWQELFASWPSSLVFLTFEDCLNWNPFFQLRFGEALAVHIKSLSIGMRREEEGFPIDILLAAFPGILSLVIPTPANIPRFATTISDLPGVGRELRNLSFRLVPDVVQPKPKISTGMLSKYVEAYPRLTKIEIPESYLRIDDDSAEDIDNMDSLMNARANELDKDVGVYLVDR